jgi:hypothetical protein
MHHVYASAKQNIFKQIAKLGFLLIPFMMIPMTRCINSCFVMCYCLMQMRAVLQYWDRLFVVTKETCILGVKICN